ncbi:MAG: methylated-DNA--[protein]-cysteine S-methyltransferase [Acidobacteriota bacterium]|nr:methylated-DNA--[protein]-cysteine S-methyltransferase [Acidobacteriota bacterium]
MYSHIEIDAAPMGRLLVGMQNDLVVFSHLVRRRPDVNAILAREAEGFPGIHALQNDHPLAAQLRRYLDGDPVDPVDVPVLWTRGTDFQQRVWRALRGVRRGNVVTYAQLAALAGAPRAARAVGNAMASNPLVLFVPCHRVVAAGGSLGGFSAGLDTKRHLLRLEGRIHDHSG